MSLRRKLSLMVPLDCLPMCKTCTFYVNDPKEDCSICRRFPPVAVTDGDSYGFEFPVVFEEDWCGEYKRRTS